MGTLPKLEKDYLDTNCYRSEDIVSEFKIKFPRINGSNMGLLKLRGLLAGTLIPVYSGRNFKLWTREDIESGKLERLNNKVRRENKIEEREFLKKTGLDLIFNDIRRIKRK